MKVIYDQETDILNLILKDAEIRESDELKEGLIIDYDAEGKVVSIEFIDASKNVSEPTGILYELKGTKTLVKKNNRVVKGPAHSS